MAAAEEEFRGGSLNADRRNRCSVDFDLKCCHVFSLKSEFKGGKLHVLLHHQHMPWFHGSPGGSDHLPSLAHHFPPHTHSLTFPTHNSRAMMSTKTTRDHFGSAQDESSARWWCVSARCPPLLPGDSNYIARKRLSENLPSLRLFLVLFIQQNHVYYCRPNKHSILMKDNEEMIWRRVDQKK